MGDVITGTLGHGATYAMTVNFTLGEGMIFFAVVALVILHLFTWVISFAGVRGI